MPDLTIDEADRCPHCDEIIRLGHQCKPKKYTCPKCDNSDQSLIESNGLEPSHWDFTLCCIAQRGNQRNEYVDIDDDYEQCGMQWSPNLYD